MSEAGRRTDVHVRGVAAGGSGVADLDDGRVVFVPRTAPGDHARIVLTKARPRWALGVLEELIEPSADRVEPGCPHYDVCGGCQLLHLPYEHQVEWKQRFIEDGLTRIGRVTDLPSVEVVPAEAATRYRSRVSFTLRRLRSGRVVAGFHGLDRPGHVVDIEDGCLLPEPAILAAWVSLRRAWGPGARLLPAGARLRIVLRAAADGVELTVLGGAPGWNPSELLTGATGISAVWHAPKDGQVSLLAGAESSGGGLSFEQVNRGMAAQLRAHVLECVGAPTEAENQLVDAYCGAGEFGRAAAEAGWEVLGIEIDAEAVRRAEAGAPSGYSVERAPVEERLAEPWSADVLVLNPPREGVAAEALEHVLRVLPSRIVYVSCDPATLGRDVEKLGSHYEVDRVRGFDLFPQTSHVETVLTLRRRGGDA